MSDQSESIAKALLLAREVSGYSLYLQRFEDGHARIRAIGQSQT